MHHGGVATSASNAMAPKPDMWGFPAWHDGPSIRSTTGRSAIVGHKKPVTTAVELCVMIGKSRSAVDLW